MAKDDKIQHQVVAGDSENEKTYNDLLSTLMAQGWNPQGGISVVWDGTKTLYYQSLIKVG